MIICSRDIDTATTDIDDSLCIAVTGRRSRQTAASVVLGNEMRISKGEGGIDLL